MDSWNQEGMFSNNQGRFSDVINKRQIKEIILKTSVFESRNDKSEMEFSNRTRVFLNFYTVGQRMMLHQQQAAQRPTMTSYNANLPQVNL